MKTEALPLIPSDPTAFNTTYHPTENSFPVIAIAVIGILATAFLLVCYYAFAIKCCLNWHRLHLLPRFPSSRRRRDDPLIPEVESRGLDESAIRAIPIFKYKNRGFGDRSFCECAVCLTEFQEEEKLRFIPNCSHAFHVDCIDVWLQNNANCPLCRTSISATPALTISQTQPLTPLFGTDENFTGNDEDYIIIDLPGRHSFSVDQSLLARTAERLSSSSSDHQQTVAQLLPLKPEERPGFKKLKTKLPRECSSKGDECIDIRTKFDVQPIRRSFSTGSSDDQRLYLMVQEMVKQQSYHKNIPNDAFISPVSRERCCNNKLLRSFFSFGGSVRGCKSSVLPIHSEP